MEKIFAPDGALEAFDFDTMLFPTSFATWHAGNFGSQVLAAAQAKKMGILTLKAMARGPWPKDAKRQQYPECRYEPLADPADAMMGLRFTFPSWA